MLDRVLSLEYSEELDKLFILTSRKPLTSSVVALCVLDVAADIDKLFDSSLYKGFDESGAETEVSLLIFTVIRTFLVLFVATEAVH